MRFLVPALVLAAGCRGDRVRGLEVDVAGPGENMSNVAHAPRVGVGRPGRFDFPANDGGWTNVCAPVEWHAEANAVILVVRTKTPCRFRVKPNEMGRGLAAGAFEGFAAAVEAGADWRVLTAPLGELAYGGHPFGNRRLIRTESADSGSSRKILGVRSPSTISNRPSDRRGSGLTAIR